VINIAIFLIEGCQKEHLRREAAVSSVTTFADNVVIRVDRCKNSHTYT